MLFCLQEVVGISMGHFSWQVIVLLMRPIAMLGVMRLVRTGYTIATLEVGYFAETGQ